ncbi:K(+)/H(+) antiporter [Orbilia oligospora]|uniref:K(+)/H(+) antiporter n=1 Tax=Orbilia oligospora TaxID=2813651 RepID=A0A7C8JKR3_ORBOL|nr:K(+)/H(+) antiporter [Orbilia oligospora]KAF3179506.1 K(+)/H(+) antiporter [Orbilia oligospora]KAF3188503.1 K(+)/H(+) antiporter [Orbilia oligospora]KAF3250121.1 K(+)/H(+) antiporter [Orbilia oligospora]KAF3263275.1 K(+)/H(+) antiporter [Orbilia oligospora]
MSSTVSSVIAAATGNSTGSKVADQTGIIGGANPSHYNKNDPIVVFIVQVFLIVVLCRLVHWPLSKLRQPRVIAEVIGGIILGPTVMGRVPGFTTSIFPAEAMPNLNLVANLGLVLFLFLIGLEVDFRVMVENWQIALGVGTLGMVVPFGFGAAIAYGLYNEFGEDPGVDEEVNFGIFLLFVGVAFSITAFPVLCRILTELKLLGTNVGIIVLAAGVGNDVVGWILLALTVALINAGSGVSAVYVLLVAVGFILFLFFVVKPIFHWYLRKTGNMGNPSQSALTVTLLICLSSAWFSNVIGIHAIFGGFVVGLICPHEGGFAVAVAEKIEDLITVLFLPLYFTLSGLRTNIGLLNSGIVWAYVIGVLAIAFITKIIGGTLAARFFKLRWRESLAVGVLMSCKGLVELIVLNIGLTAGVISQRTFTIFVVMALVTTFATTPLVTFLYPEWYQKKCLAWRAGKINWDGTPTAQSEDEVESKAKTTINRLTVLLRLDTLPSLMSFVSLLKGEQDPLPPLIHKSKKGEESSSKAEEEVTKVEGPRAPRLEVHGLRLRELGERTSAVMRVAEEHEFAERDPVVNTFKAFGRMNNIACATGLSIVPEDSFSGVLIDRAKDTSSDLLVVPWSETGQISDNYDQNLESKEQQFGSGPYVHFLTSLVQDSTSRLAIFINRGFGGVSRSDRALTRRNSTVSGAVSRVKTGIQESATLPVLDPSHHIFFPFIGGADDRAALRFVLQLVKNTNVTATIVQVVSSASAEAASKEVSTIQPTTSSAGSVTEDDAAFYLQIAASIPSEISQRVVFETLETDSPIQTIITRAKQEVGTTLKNAGDLVVVGRTHTGSYASQVSAVTSEHAPPVSSDARKIIGVVAESVLAAQVRASLLVYRA